MKDYFEFAKGVPMDGGWYFVWYTDVVVNRHFWTPNNTCRITRNLMPRLVLDVYPVENEVLHKLLDVTLGDNFVAGILYREYISSRKKILHMLR